MLQGNFNTTRTLTICQVKKCQFYIFLASFLGYVFNLNGIHEGTCSDCDVLVDLFVHLGVTKVLRICELITSLRLILE